MKTATLNKSNYVNKNEQKLPGKITKNYFFVNNQSVVSMMIILRDDVTDA